jgi:hypothetical protein
VRKRLEGWRLAPEHLTDGRWRIVLEERLAEPYAGWIVTAVFVTNATRTDARLVRLTIEHEAGNDAPAATARMLRTIRPEQLRLGVLTSALVDEMENEPNVGGDAREAIYGAFDAQTKRQGRPVQIPDRDLARLASDYVDLVARKAQQPVRDLASNRELPVSTVRGMLDTARRRGLLESEGRGKIGGRLTPKARRLLHKKGRRQ